MIAVAGLARGLVEARSCCGLCSGGLVCTPRRHQSGLLATELRQFCDIDNVEMLALGSIPLSLVLLEDFSGGCQCGPLRGRTLWLTALYGP